MPFPAQSFTGKAISASYQRVVQGYIPGGSTYYILDGTGNILFSFFSASLGGQLVTSNQTSSMALSASWASASLSSSFSDVATSASFAITASFSISSSFAPGSSNSTSASFASQSISSSNSVSSSYALSASFSFGSSGTTLVTGSTYQITASWAISSSWASKAFSSSYADTASVLFGSVTSASYALSSSAAASITFVPSTTTSASWVSASNKITTADTASYVAGANVVGAVTSASYASTSSVVLGTITSASYATTSSYAISSSNANTASSLLGNVTSASFATTASYSVSASFSPPSGTTTSASFATTASYAAVYSVPSLGTDWAIDDFESYSVGSTTVLSNGVGWTSPGTGSGMSIISRTMGNGTVDLRLSLLNNADFMRKFPWGSNWHRLRIGICATISASATFTGSDWAMGICSNTSSLSSSYMSSATANWIGCGSVKGSNTTATRNAGTDNPYFLAAANSLLTRLQNTDTGIAGGVGSTILPATSATGSNNRLILMFDVARATYGVTTYTVINHVTQNTSNLQEDDMGVGSLIESLKRYDVSILDMGHSGTGTVSYSEASGSLDTFNIWWNNAQFPIEISAIAAWKIR